MDGLAEVKVSGGAMVPMVDTDGLETVACRCIDGQVDIVIDAIKEDAHVNCLLEESEFETDHKLSMKEDVSEVESPFTSLNSKINKNLTASGVTSRGAMLLNLSRKANFNSQVPSSKKKPSASATAQRGRVGVKSVRT